MKKDLHLHVKGEYFEAIKNGSKTEEYRLKTDYWRKRILGKIFGKVIIYNGYKPGPENRIERPFSKVKEKTIKHPHFGESPVSVFAIQL